MCPVRIVCVFGDGGGGWGIVRIWFDPMLCSALRHFVLQVAVLSPADACNATTLRFTSGHGSNRRLFGRRRWWGLVDRGICSFAEKAKNVQAAGSWLSSIPTPLYVSPGLAAGQSPVAV